MNRIIIRQFRKKIHSSPSERPVETSLNGLKLFVKKKFESGSNHFLRKKILFPDGIRDHSFITAVVISLAEIVDCAAGFVQGA
jgi:hypothetical protein